MHSIKRVFVVGSSGFIGQRVCRDLVMQGFEVSALALGSDYFPENLQEVVHYTRANVDQLSDGELVALFKGQEALIYALGPDDRVPPPVGVTAADFYNKHLVDRTARIARLAKSAGVQRLILLGSYFTYFDEHGCGELRPGTLSQHHPYINARRLQYEIAAAEGPDIILIEIPYVFGVTPPWPPIWRKVVVNNFKGSPFIFFGSGGSTLISVDKLSKSIVRAVTLGQPGDKLPVGGKNMDYKGMMQTLLNTAGIRKPLLIPPTWLLTIILKMKWRMDQSQHRENGLDYRFLAQDILARDFYVDFTPVDAQLQMTGHPDDSAQAIVEAGKAMRGS